MMLTLERLKEVLHYDQITGVFTWRVRLQNNAPAAGARAGTAKKETGHLVIGIDGERYFANKLAWFYVHGAWPDREVDHANCDASDNRWVNLRLATRAQNIYNRRLNKNNRSGVKGVSWDSKRKQWLAQIMCNRKSRQLGRFANKEEAKAAYDKAALALHGEFARLE